MPRPTNKKELLAQSRSNYDALNAFIDGLSPADRERAFKPGTMNRNIRDVLAHLHHWHLLFLEWYAVGMTGGKPPMPAKGYTWAQNRELNEAIHAQWNAVPLKMVLEKLKTSHAQLHALIVRHSEAELFTKQRYAWTGTTSLAAYITGATSSHYAWAIKLIRKGMTVPGK